MACNCILDQEQLISGVPRTKTKKNRNEVELLDQATSQLLKVIKAKATKDGKPLNREELLKQGYSERFLAKLESA